MAKVYRISSTLNDRLKQWALLSNAKRRKREGRFICEGIKVVKTAMEHGWKPVTLLLNEKKFPEIPQGFDCEEVFFLSENAFKKISSLKVPQGIAAVFAIPKQSVDFLLDEDGFSMIAAVGVQDPGNLGAIIRVAAGSGCSAFVSIGDSADIYSPKVIRGSSGLVFSIPSVSMTEDDFESFIRYAKASVYSSTGDGGIDYRDIIPPNRSVLMIGSEGIGLPEKWLNFDVKVTIPLSNSCESLNASVAAGILAFRLFQQK